MTKHDMTAIARTLADAQSEIDALAEKLKCDSALWHWQAVTAEAERLGYASRARDLAPMHDATTRSIKIRTGKLARFIAAMRGLDAQDKAETK